MAMAELIMSRDLILPSPRMKNFANSIMEQIKLIVILGIEECQSEIPQLFLRLKIPVFSQVDIKGFQLKVEKTI